jgi:hypothetical protein
MKKVRQRCRNMFYCGKTDGSISKSFSSLKKCFEWIDQRKLIDPKGVNRGDYFIDIPVKVGTE